MAVNTFPRLTYYELLQHPKWQEKRLRIMERDTFTCVECGNNDATLHVHHAYYTKGAAPWDYPDDSLKTLCGDCHGAVEAVLARIKHIAGTLTIHELYLVEGVLLGYHLRNNPEEPVELHHRLNATGIGRMFGATDEEVLAAQVDGALTGRTIWHFYQKYLDAISA